MPLRTPQVYHNPGENAPALAHKRNILNEVQWALIDSGLEGEDRAGKLLYICLSSRMLRRPVSPVVKGQSSAGKSYTTERVMALFPDRIFWKATGMSERVLAYTNEDFKHRFIVVFEEAGIYGELLEYMMRSLLSEGCLEYRTVVKTVNGFEERIISKEGPTGLLTTTTRYNLHSENETRMLSIPINDSPEQTSRVMAAVFSDESRSIDVRPWHEYHEWLEANWKPVVIPYGKALAEGIPPSAVRLRRDAGALRALIETLANMHQLHRRIDAQGRIIADVEEYAMVRELVEDLYADTLAATVRPDIRETVNAVSELLEGREGTVAQYELVEPLGVDKGTVSRRVGKALKEGYLVNEEERPGRPAKLVLGEPMPEDGRVLPLPEELEAGDSIAA